MTDEMRVREEAICRAAKVSSIGEVSDGFHTFNGLYEQRMILFAALVKAYKDKAWKSYRHADGEYCFGGGWFIVGIDTPEGSYTYHYENKYWDMFDCMELPISKPWDGHNEADAKTRLMSLQPEPHWIPVTERLPDISKSVLICDIEGDIYLGHRTRYGDYYPDFYDDRIKNVTAWMPLPEHYKEVTE